MEDRQIIWTFYLVIVTIAVITLFIFVRNSANDELFRQKTLVLDLAFLEDIVIAGPGNIEVNYNIKEDYLEEFYLKTETCKFFTKLNVDVLIYDVSAECFDDKSLKRDTDIILLNPEKIKFKKENNNIKISN